MLASITIFDRVFHPDEANQAFTTARLIETGRYEYRPDDHHGPTLYYAAAAIQKAAGCDSLAEMDGTLLRCTPLIFSILALIVGFLFIRKLVKPAAGKFFGWLTPCLFAILLGTSPIFVFFATDFIQEMLLACFTMMTLWCAISYLHARTGNLAPTRNRTVKPGTWALLFGIAAGLAFATKETSLITFAAAAIAGIPLAWTHRKNIRFETRDAVLALAGLLLTAILLFSSFASNWHGVYNAFIAAPLSYLGRAAGSAASKGAADHVHPWWQYLKWIFSNQPMLSCFIAIGFLHGVLALIPSIARKVIQPRIKTAFMFAAAYSILLLMFYSAIPYKTPWCALQIHMALLLASFLGVISFLYCSPVLVLSIVLLVGNMTSITKIWSDPDSKDIPYNYASASPEVKQLATTVATAMSSSAMNQEASFIAVALPPSDTWPFPWYNRPYEAKTGYWTSIDDLKHLADAGKKPSVVIVPMAEGHIAQALFPHLKHTKRLQMRPGVRVRIFW